MKKANYSIGILSAVLTAVMFLSSCSTTSVTQRRYNKGLHIEWAGKSKGKETVVVSEKANKTPANAVTDKIVETDAEVEVQETFAGNVSTDENVEYVFPSKVKPFKMLKSLKKSGADDLGLNKADVLKAKSLIKKTVLKAKKQETPAPSKLSGMAVAGFICGLLGLILLFVAGFPFLMGTLGLIFSIIGMGQTSAGKNTQGRGFAIAGLILSILTIFLFWLLVFFVAALVLAFI